MITIYVEPCAGVVKIRRIGLAYGIKTVENLLGENFSVKEFRRNIVTEL
jgi:hypothetical protein